MTAVSLVKRGQKVSLRKIRPSLERAYIGLGWKANAGKGPAYDLDVSAFLLTNAGQVSNHLDFVFYGNEESKCGSVQYGGDNRIGGTEGDEDGDQEFIRIDLSLIPKKISRVLVCVTIDQAKVRKQSFGSVSSAYARLVDEATNDELVRFDLTDEYKAEDAMQMVELVRNGEGWDFSAIGQGHSNGLYGLATDHGIEVADD